jgi:hypothetical protein
MSIELKERTLQSKLRYWALADGYPGPPRELLDEAAAQIDALTAERDELQHRNEVEVASRKELQRLLGNAQAERDALKRHYDGAGPEHNLLALLDLYNDRRGEADNAAANARDEAAALRAQLATALQQCANGAAKLAAIESLPRCGLVTSQMGGLLIAERPDGAWVSYEKLRAALATPSATVIRPCPHCGKEGEADAAETELTCPYCGYDWSVPATPSAQESKGAGGHWTAGRECGKCRWDSIPEHSEFCPKREASPERGTGGGLCRLCAGIGRVNQIQPELHSVLCPRCKGDGVEPAAVANATRGATE